MDVNGSVAIVTGGASGIGHAIAKELSRRGATVVILDRDATRGEQIAAETGNVFARADVADEAEVAAAVGVATALGPLRIVVNAAGISLPERTIDRDNKPHSLASFDKHLRVNLLGTFNVVRLAAAAMAAQEPYSDDGARGVIVNLASVAAFDGQIGQAAYAASKGGIVGMTLPIARDLAVVGIRVNTIAPGLIDTPIYDVIPNTEEFKAKLSAGVLFPKRLGRPDEPASMVMELISNDYMNGEVVRVDAGIRLGPK